MKPTLGSCRTTPAVVWDCRGRRAAGRQVHRAFTGKSCVDQAVCQAVWAEDLFSPDQTFPAHECMYMWSIAK